MLDHLDLPAGSETALCEDSGRQIHGMFSSAVQDM